MSTYSADNPLYKKEASCYIETGSNTIKTIITKERNTYEEMGLPRLRLRP